MSTFGKDALAEVIGSHHGLSRTRAREIIDTIFDCIGARAEGGDTVQITGFGSFVMVAHGERNVRNPQTGEMQRMGPTRRLKFRASKRPKAEPRA